RFHFPVADRAEVDIGRNVRRRRKDLPVGNAVHIVSNCGMDVVKPADDALGGRSAAGADGTGALGLTSPAALQLIKCGVKLAPLAAREEAPLQGVLQAIIVLSCPAASDLGAGALDMEPVENRMMRGPVVGALADHAIQSAPVTGIDGLAPTIQVGEDQ